MPTKEEAQQMEREEEPKWSCHYCKKQFERLFDRDMHHRTEHIEHYRYLFFNSMEMVRELQAEISDLKLQIEAFSKHSHNKNFSKEK